MVNYSAVINIIKSEKYIDKSDCFEHFWGLKHVTLEVSLETISRKYGYQTEMDKFLSSFIVKDVYDYCNVFLQIGDPTEEGSSWIIRDCYLTYRNFCTLFSDIHSDRHRKLIVDKEQQNHFDIPGYISEAFDWDAYIANGRKKIQQAKKEIEQERQRRILYEKQKYAIELSPDIPRFSQNMGIRKKIIEKTSPGYQQFNALLVGIYNKFKPSFDAESIYEFFQGFNKNVRIQR